MFAQKLLESLEQALKEKNLYDDMDEDEYPNHGNEEFRVEDEYVPVIFYLADQVKFWHISKTGPEGFYKDNKISINQVRDLIETAQSFLHMVRNQEVL